MWFSITSIVEMIAGSVVLNRSTRPARCGAPDCRISVCMYQSLTCRANAEP